MKAPSVGIVGGGLAGIAAAVALREAGCRVTLFEARRVLGGRAASHRDPDSGELVDLCQHVSMACCTNLTDLCRRVGIADHFRSDRVLHFFDPEGHHDRISSTRWLPAPFHLLPSFINLRFLGWSDKWRVARALRALLAEPAIDRADGPNMFDWLRRHRATNRAIERFWSVVLVSALGDTLENVSVPAARKVFLDGFLASPTVMDVLIPQRPLSELFDKEVGAQLRGKGVEIVTSQPIESVTARPEGGYRLVTGDREGRDFDAVILAVPWNQVDRLMPPGSSSGASGPTRAEEAICDTPSLEGAPITGIHLWADRPLMVLPHAVLVGRTAQWVFQPNYGSNSAGTSDAREHYYQVVVSGSRELLNRDREEIVQHIWGELLATWPSSPPPNLLRSRVVTVRDAVFSPRPGSDEFRPSQRTPIHGLYLAGDWTATGWPATMEGAARSGYLAAEALLKDAGMPPRGLVPEAPRGQIMRSLTRGSEE